MHILLTNDDGIHAVGLRAMYEALLSAGHRVSVVAPLTEQSAVGHAVTIAMPLKVRDIAENGFRGRGVAGTPVDCVKLGLTCLLAEDAPDLVVSGINAGANVGVDVLYSGTVSAATEGALMNFPSLAVSMDDFTPEDLSGQARWAAGFIGRMDWSLLPEKTLLNLNFPDRAMDETLPLAVCPQTGAAYRDWYEVRKDPRGGTYYWLDGVIPPEKVAPDTDRAMLTAGHVTLTPLTIDLNDQALLATLSGMALDQE